MGYRSIHVKCTLLVATLAMIGCPIKTLDKVMKDEADLKDSKKLPTLTKVM